MGEQDAELRIVSWKWFLHGSGLNHFEPSTSAIPSCPRVSSLWKIRSVSKTVVLLTTFKASRLGGGAKGALHHMIEKPLRKPRNRGGGVERIRIALRRNLGALSLEFVSAQVPFIITDVVVALMYTVYYSKPGS
jgi:hypothetical protein